MKALAQAAVTVSLHGAYDISTREHLRRQLSEAACADEAVIDLSDVTFAGTTLLNELLALKKTMRRNGSEGAIRIVGSNPQLRKVLTITCLDRLFEVA